MALSSSADRVLVLPCSFRGSVLATCVAGPAVGRARIAMGSGSDCCVAHPCSPLCFRARRMLVSSPSSGDRLSEPIPRLGLSLAVRGPSLSSSAPHARTSRPDGVRAPESCKDPEVMDRTVPACALGARWRAAARVASRVRWPSRRVARLRPAGPRPGAACWTVGLGPRRGRARLTPWCCRARYGASGLAASPPRCMRRVVL